MPSRAHFRKQLILVATLTLLGGANAQTNSKGPPTFEDYPVKEIFRGVPHPPILATPEERLYRTRIREGVEKGWGALTNGREEQKGPGPNFAGHYVVIVWGCGAPCLRMAVADIKTGAVYDPPVSEGGLALPLLAFPISGSSNPELAYRRDSQLLIIKATPHWGGRPDARSYAFYFLFQNQQWKLLRRVPITEALELK